MNTWQVPEGTCRTCGHAYSDHCVRVTAWVVRRLQRAMRQNRHLANKVHALEADLANITGQRDVYLDEIRKLNSNIRRAKEPA